MKRLLTLFCHFFCKESGEELHDTVPDGMTYEAYFDILREAFKVQDKEASRFNYGIARHSTIKTDAVVRQLSPSFSPLSVSFPILTLSSLFLVQMDHQNEWHWS